MDVVQATTTLTKEDANALAAKVLAEERALTAAKKEQAEMLSKAVPAAPASADAESRLQYLMAQSEVFAHFLAGSGVVPDEGKKKKKKNGEGRTRMTEEAEVRDDEGGRV